MVLIYELEIMNSLCSSSYMLATTSSHPTPTNGKRKIGSVGHPIPYTKAKIVDVEKGIDELPKGASICAKELLRWCEGRMARYKVPRGIEFRDTLPKTIVGKILRRQLVEEYKEVINSL